MSDYSHERRNQIVGTLRLLGVVRCNIRYSGGGDSGSIDDVIAYMSPEDTEGQKVRDLVKADSDEAILIQVRDRLLGEPVSQFEEQVTELAYDLLDHLDVDDWVNNDGGCGEITIYVDEHPDDDDTLLGRIEVAHSAYYTESRNTSYAL